MVHKDFFKRLEIFRDLPEEQIQELADTAELHHFGPGDMIVMQNTPGRAVYIVISGRVKMFMTSPDGKEQTLFFFGSGEPFCLCSYFQKQPFPADAAALEQSTILVIPGSGLERLALKDPALLFNILGVLSRRLKEAMLLVESLALKGIPQRLASFLLHARQMNCSREDMEKFELCITQRELAKILGTTPETLSRVIRKMEEEKILDGSGRTISILNQSALERTAGG